MANLKVFLQTMMGKDEWEAWRTVCVHLRVLGVVTEDDLRAPVGRTNTPGECLFTELRAWGELRARQGARKLAVETRRAMGITPSSDTVCPDGPSCPDPECQRLRREGGA